MSAAVAERRDTDRITPGDGARCPLCGQAMWSAFQALEHGRTTAAGDGRLVHRACNRRPGRGAGGSVVDVKSVQQRPTSRQW